MPKVLLVAMDMDSTLIRVELIDEVARAHGVFEQVEQITKRAMAGEIEFRESLQQRVALLKGFSQRALNGLVDGLELSQGAETLIKFLKNRGHRVGMITGGFEPAGKSLKARLGLDFAFCNRLGTNEGVLTGTVLEPIIDAQAKADLLHKAAKQFDVPLKNTIAIGDGANDRFMLQTAGLGIAFHPKSDLSAYAKVSITEGGLDGVLHLLDERIQ